MNTRNLLAAAIGIGCSLSPALAQTTYSTTTIEPSAASTTTTTVESMPVAVPSTPVIVTPAATSETTVIKDKRERKHLLRLGVPLLFHVNVL